MAPSAGISGVGVAAATAGALLMYAGIRDVPVLQALREVTGGTLPKGNADADGAQGGSAAAARAVLDTSGGSGSGIVQAGALGGSLPQLAAAALRYRGIPYKLGGRNPGTGFDCSGLVQRSFADIGIKAPATTYTQQPWSALKTIPAAQASVGDLVFWPGHVAIVVGPGQVVHAPKPGTVVRLEQTSSAGPRGTSPTFKRYAGAGSAATKKPPKTAQV